MKFNELVAKGEIKAPIVIGRDHLDAGSVASPNRETEGMLDGTDAVSDWPILNALINAVGGATWVSFHHGGGVGIGYSQHAGMVIVADGTPEAAGACNACSPPTPAWAWSAMPMQVIPKRLLRPNARHPHPHVEGLNLCTDAGPYFSCLPFCSDWAPGCFTPG